MNRTIEKTVENQYNPISDHIGLPDVDTFISNLQRDHPDDCMLDTIEPRPKREKKQKSTHFEVETPTDKAIQILYCAYEL